MTDGQKIIWAAVFATRLNEVRKLHEQVGIEFHEHEHVASLAEEAAYAVINLEKGVTDIEEGFGKDDKITIMAKEMIGY